MLSRLKEKGLKICVWINPYIAQNQSFSGRKGNGYFLKTAGGCMAVGPVAGRNGHRRLHK
ncbi:hypothetical protein PO124_21385 [Bacillus licheniformis]|nr:hypothetical protein [Bacillus licheniformis]